ncbi:uncharacterized protein LOC123502803 isoform X2 [Portunus trituberculatus]|uniref:uncharacterized protein LOC123502803 isoform X2 n=1 Tax=Portunus trituberculatus TaxID=210409 RepID=UPI001E1CDB8B|nr:uncharacterized protein LOC123502803 isoform X2 [Portunus trituberculatus]
MASVCRARLAWCGRSETSSVHSAHEGPRPRLHTPIESVYVKQALYYLLMGLAIVGLLLALNAYLRCFRPPATPTPIPRPLPPRTPSLDAPPPYASIQPPSYEQATRGRRHSFSGRRAEAEGLMRGGWGCTGQLSPPPLFPPPP